MAQSLVAFARQAWIQADANRYNGAHQEVLWKAFASRGLGVGAENYKDSSLLPSHFKPVVIKREKTKLPPPKDAATDSDSGGVAVGSIVSVIVNPKTVVTIFGVRDSSSVLKLDLSDPNPACHSIMDAESQGRADRCNSEVAGYRIF